MEFIATLTDKFKNLLDGEEVKDTCWAEWFAVGDKLSAFEFHIQINKDAGFEEGSFSLFISKNDEYPDQSNVLDIFINSQNQKPDEYVKLLFNYDLIEESENHFSLRKNKQQIHDVCEVKKLLTQWFGITVEFKELY